jgi:hypothetical protein
MLSPTTYRPNRLAEWTSRLHRTESVISRLIRCRDLTLPLTFFSVGFAPITSLALALFAIMPLHVSTRAFVLPSVVLAVVLGCWQPSYGRMALLGYAFGLVAVLVYDLSRMPLILTGVWNDFIPNIGALLLQREEGHRTLGYTWRWLGNGAGMGMAFFMVYPLLARWLPVRTAAVLFGVFVWLCLLATLIFAPLAQTLLFRLTPLTFATSLFGHLVYGGALGLLMWKTGLNVRPYALSRVEAGAPGGVPDAAVA